MRAQIAGVLEPLGQYGVAVSNGAKRVGLPAQLAVDADGVVISIDGKNAFNSVSRACILKQTAQHCPSLFSYVQYVYGPGSTPDLIFALDGVQDAVSVPSRQDVQQGDPLGPLLFAL